MALKWTQSKLTKAIGLASVVGAASALSPVNRVEKSPKDSIDVSKLKSVRECPESVLQALLLFCSEKSDQELVLFVTLVLEFKSSDDAVRKNIGE